MNFLVRRIARALLLLIGVSILSFALSEIAPGDYLDGMRVNPEISAATIERIRQRIGLDRPLPERYFRWVGSALRGDLGVSFAYNMPVTELLLPRAARTLLLAALALLATWLLAVPLGVLAAARRGGLTNRVVGASATALVALPDLLIGLACLLLALKTGWLAVSGSLPLCVLALTLVSFPAVFRHTRSSVGQALEAPFADHLRALGVAEQRILFAHVLPAAANPLITLVGLSLGAMLSSSLIVEVVLGWPGLGPLLLESILARDLYVVLAAVMASTCMLIVGLTIADLLLYAADPRIRREEA